MIEGDRLMGHQSSCHAPHDGHAAVHELYRPDTVGDRLESERCVVCVGNSIVGKMFYRKALMEERPACETFGPARLPPPVAGATREPHCITCAVGCPQSRHGSCRTHTRHPAPPGPFWAAVARSIGAARMDLSLPNWPNRRSAILSANFNS